MYIDIIPKTLYTVYEKQYFMYAGDSVFLVRTKNRRKNYSYHIENKKNAISLLFTFKLAC